MLYERVVFQLKLPFRFVVQFGLDAWGTPAVSLGRFVVPRAAKAGGPGHACRVVERARHWR